MMERFLLASQALQSREQPAQYRKYIVTGMTCAACSSRVEKVVSRIPGIVSVRVNLSTERAYVLHQQNDADELVLSAIRKAGFDGALDTREHAKVHEQQKLAAYKILWNKWYLSLVLMTCLMVDMYLSMKLGKVVLPTWCEWAVATVIQGLIGIPFYRGAIRALHGKSANMDVLVALASGVSYAYSTVLALLGSHMVSFDGAAMVLVMVTLGKLLEMRAKRRVRELMQSRVNEHEHLLAHRISNGNQLHETPASLLVPGDVVRVLASEIIPTDAVVLQGLAVVDESLLTGESHPIEKGPGELVYGGSKNLNHEFVVQVVRTFDETMYTTMMQMVDHAGLERTPTRAWIDRVTAVFVPAVVLVAVAALLVPLHFGAHLSQALTNAVAVLVAACPCALGLATPTALSVGLHIGLRHGVGLQNEERLLQLRNVDTVVFDKTGTLTTGKLRVEHITSKEGIHPDTVLALAASAEQGVEHPVARAIVSAALANGLSLAEEVGDAISERQGIRRRIRGRDVFVGKWDRVGNPRRATSQEPLQVQHDATLLGNVDVIRDGIWLGTIWYTDDIRPEAAQVIESLQRQGVRVVMLTGDNPESAQYTATRLNLANYHAQLTAADKTGFIRHLQQEGRMVAMVGDGVNDAPALKTADVGIAFGAATPESLASADVAILNGNLLYLPWARHLADATLAKIRENLIWAVLYNSISIPLAFLGVLSPMWAGLGMALSSVLVMTNSLLLQNKMEQNQASV